MPQAELESPRKAVRYNPLLGDPLEATMLPMMEDAMVDNMILSYLDHAMEVGYEPAEDDEALALQKVAALRLYFWTNMAVGETALAQSQRVKDPEVREQLNRLVTILLPEYRVPEWEREALDARTAELRKLHSDEEDCRIVAEAELIGVETLLTFDKTMKKRLEGVARVRISFPEERWQSLAIPRGHPPIREPHPSNPLRERDFWRWK